MSRKQIETFFSKVQEDKVLKKQVEECGSNNSCIAAIGIKTGHKFSPARVSRWLRDHRTSA